MMAALRADSSVVTRADPRASMTAAHWVLLWAAQKALQLAESWVVHLVLHWAARLAGSKAD
jgi:hypothetical protein